MSELHSYIGCLNCIRISVDGYALRQENPKLSAGPWHRKLTFAVSYRCLRALALMGTVTRLANRCSLNCIIISFDGYALRQLLIEHVLTEFLSIIVRCIRD